jgi:ubiquinone biosynthesis protein UbiJ
MKNSGSKPHSRKKFAPKQLPTEPAASGNDEAASADLHERVSAVDQAIQRMRKRLASMEKDLLEIQAYLLREEEANEPPSKIV